MSNSWIIREAIAQDADGLKNCMLSAYTAYQARMEGTRLPPMDVDYASEIAHYPVWAVESAGKILAGLVMSFEDDAASIANVAVDPGYQGQGIGGALMQFAETQAIDKGHRELHLATHVLLVENLALYRHLGWQEIARDQTRVVMKKDLGRGQASPG